MKGILKLFLLALVVSANNPKFVAGHLPRQEKSPSKVSSNDSVSATALKQRRSPVLEMPFDYSRLDDVVDKMKATQKAMNTLKRFQKKDKNGANNSPLTPRR